MARPGQVVEVSGGRYPGQAVRDDTSKASPRDVVFRPVAGERVVVGGEVRVSGRHIEFQSMRFVSGWYVEPRAQDVTFRDIRSAHLFVSGARDVRVLGGSIGPGVDYHPIIAPAGTLASANIVIDGVLFHDWTVTDPAIHTECLQVASPNGLVIRRSRFVNCTIFSVFVTHWGDAGPPRDILIENNYFDESIDGSYSVFFADHAPSLTNVVIRYNSALMPFNFEPESAKVGVRVVGNVAPLPAWGCSAGVEYRHNIWSAARCGATDRRESPGFRNPRALDLRPSSSSAAVDGGDPREFPQTDIRGRPRPAGGTPDAGAVEVR